MRFVENPFGVLAGRHDPQGDVDLANLEVPVQTLVHERPVDGDDLVLPPLPQPEDRMPSLRVEAAAGVNRLGEEQEVVGGEAADIGNVPAELETHDSSVEGPEAFQIFDSPEKAASDVGDIVGDSPLLEPPSPERMQVADEWNEDALTKFRRHLSASSSRES